MKKLLKVALAFAMVATLATGCGAKAKYAKAGLGVVSSYNTESGQVNTTFVALGLDADGKIAHIDLDVAQSTPGAEKGEYDKTKEERGADYGMKGVSPIGKEWYEQAAALEEWAKGKSVDEITGMATKDYHGGKAPDGDLAASVTITVDGPLAAIAKAK